MEGITFEEIRKLAEIQGITGNRVVIGIWAKINGYKAKRKMINRVSRLLYYKDTDKQE